MARAAFRTKNGKHLSQVLGNEYDFTKRRQRVRSLQAGEGHSEETEVTDEAGKAGSSTPR